MQYPLQFRSIELADSRVFELRKSNDPPLKTEHLQLESFIDEGRGFLATLQERVSHARAALDELLEEEKRVQDMIESCKTIVSPIRRIPEDIVREISLVSWETDEERKDSLNANFAPFVLSQVCREWRKFVLSMSRLWSTIRLDFNSNRHDSMARQYLLQTYLLRSATHDITLSIYSKREISQSHLIPILLLSAPRWTDVFISIPQNSMHTFSAVRGCLHRLNRLHVEYTNGIFVVRAPFSKPKFDAFEYAPLLRSFSINGVCNGVKQMYLPWPQLTTYTAHDWTSTYLDIFKLAPDMKTATLQCDDDSEDDVPLPTTYSSHQRLRVLYLREVDESDVVSEGGTVRFLSHVEFPVLESLSMSYAHTRIRIPSFLCGSTAGTLKSLIIDALFAIPVEAQVDLLCLLKTTPLLSRLSISCRSVPEGNENNGLLLELNANANPGLLPCLTSLEFCFINTNPYLDPSFVDMVQSRRYLAPARVALETLRLSVPFVFLSANNEINVRWKDMCDEGLVTYGVDS
ncbi:hypothetical protein EV421DRAFT_1131537 [Armillaria borealis]|uniref:F-box domain-containing protein n=1 Tax=Armillaria borealis TaxID=47425 RepID=A0AA39MIL4_9AGAR|nr:hypothetical protein EV421DRAFT_1131537 [Armillaria borealis]